MAQCYSSDTYEFDPVAETWTCTVPYYCRGSDPSGRPAARCTFGMAFSEKDQVVMLFGTAYSSGSAGPDTWLYDAKTNNWTFKHKGYLAGGYCGMMPVYDKVTDHFYVFEYGPSHSDQSRSGVMFKYSISSNQWINCNSQNTPGSNWCYVMAISEKRRVIVLYSTGSSTGTYVYRIEDNAWTKLQYNTAAHPGGRYRSGMDYDLVNDVFIMMGGKNSPDDLWELKLDADNNSGTWTDITASTTNFPYCWTSEHRAAPFRYDRTHNVFWIDGGWRGTHAFRYGKGLNTEQEERQTACNGQQTLRCLPNPFKGSVSIKVPNAGKEITTMIYNAAGRKVAYIKAEKGQSKSQSITWNAADLPNGIYLVRVKTGRKSFSQRLILAK